MAVEVDIIINCAGIGLAVIFLIAFICGLIWNLTADDYIDDVKAISKKVMTPTKTSCVPITMLGKQQSLKANQRASAGKQADSETKGKKVSFDQTKQLTKKSVPAKPKLADKAPALGPNQLIPPADFSVVSNKSQSANETKKRKKTKKTKSAAENLVAMPSDCDVTQWANPVLKKQLKTLNQRQKPQKVE